MPTQFQGGVQGMAKPAPFPSAQPAVMPQTTPGGLQGSISNNPYQAANVNNNSSVGTGFRSASPGATSNNNPNRTNFLTNNGRVDTGVDNFRQFGDTYYNHMMDRTADQRQQQNNALAQSLVNRGLQPGTEAYNAEMARMDQRNNDFMSGTAAQAEQLGLAAQNQYFGQEMQNNQYNLAQNQQNYMQGFGYDQLANQRDIAGIGASAQMGAASIGANSANYRAELANALATNQLNENARQYDIGKHHTNSGHGPTV